MELVLASNFDDALVAGASGLPVAALFGNYPVSLTGGGRPPQILPSVTADAFRRHVARVHASGRRFYATLNTNDLDLREYDREFLSQFLREVAHLLDLGVDGFVVALPILIEAITSEHPGVPITVSSFARVRTVTQAEYYQRMGADAVVIEEANRDFKLLRGLVRLGLKPEVLVNQTCIPSCPYRAHHLNTSSVASQGGRTSPRFEYPILECGLEYVRDPARILSSIFVRPEDLEIFEEAGVDRFKISGRNRPTAWLLRAARAYADRRYDGNLLDILSFVQIRGPRRALAEAAARGEGSVRAGRLRDAFDALSEIEIQNGAFPDGFLRRIASTDCEHIACSDCGFCAAVAEKVLRIAGRPPSAYSAPSELPAPTCALASFGGTG
jgi:collagenase-like PrtC family protease